MNNTAYVQPKRAVRKLEYARAFAETVYIGAAAGYGKTELVRHVLKDRESVIISCKHGWTESSVSGNIDRLRGNNPTAHMTVFIDDLQALCDAQRQQFLLSLSEERKIWLVMAGRSSMPDWLSALSAAGSLITIEEQDLSLDQKETAQLLAAGMGTETVEAESLRRAFQYSMGMPVLICILAKLLREDSASSDGQTVLTDETIRACGNVYRGYLDRAVVSDYDSDLVQFCMQVSVVDAFDASLSEYITGEAWTGDMVRRFRQLSCDMIDSGNGQYRFREPMLQLFRERRDHFYEAGEVKEFCYNAGLCYEARGRIPEAARMYGRSGSGRILDLLVLNGKRSPASGYYYELKDCYMALQDEDVLRSVYLMSGMSMFCALMLDPEKSEYWYRELKAYRDEATGGQKRAADIQLLFLDISLPQRGVGNLAGIFQKMPQMVFCRGYELPEFSVTSNLPSMLDGGKDFSEWTRHDRALASSIGKIVERALGRYGRGLVPLALAESQLEKGGNVAEIISWICERQMQARSGGKIEMEFVAAGLLVKMNCMAGRWEDAAAQLAAFRARAEEKGADRLLENIDAMRCFIALLTGDAAAAEGWMKKAPDETKDFFVMRRLSYLVKVRCYIASGEYARAAALARKLLSYASRYHRTLVQIEADLLMAVICFREKNEAWKEYFTEALRLSGDYRFVHTVSREGAAVLPILQKIMKEPDIGGLRGIVPDLWLRKVLSETEKYARRFPAYLRGEKPQKAYFSKKDIDVLIFQARGFSVSQIAGALDMKPETVRYHIKQNYRKLQVSSKSEAVLAAQDLGLLQGG